MGKFTIEYWMAWAFGFVSTAITGAFCLLVKRYRSMRIGMQALIRAQIYQIVRAYEPLGYLPLEERENLDDLYSAYEEMNGKNSVKCLVEKMFALPTEPPKKER